MGQVDIRQEQEPEKTCETHGANIRTMEGMIFLLATIRRIQNLCGQMPPTSIVHVDLELSPDESGY